MPNDLTVYEEDLLKTYPDNSGYKLIIEAAKKARQNKKITANFDKYDFGASFSGPFLYNYVSYILKDCIEKGYKTLYFVARDGFIPQKIADIIIKKLNLDIKTKYIYGSRLAWRIPDEENYNEIVEKIFSEYSKRISLKYIAYRLRIETEFLQKNLDIKSIKKYFSFKEENKIKERLLNDADIKKFIIDANKKNKEILEKYVKQEIDLTQSNLAFVEINGTGATQEFLARAINKVSYPNKITLINYFITVRGSLNSEISTRLAYFEKQVPYDHTVELLTRNTSGQTIGYALEKDNIIPLLEEIKNNRLSKWGYNEYLQGIIDFSENITDSKKLIDDVNFCYFYFDYLTVKCNKKIADIVGTIPFLSIGDETKTPEAAPKLNLFECLKTYYEGKIPDKYWAFPYLTAARTQKGINKILCNPKPKFNLTDFKLEIKLFLKLFQNRNKKIAFWGASIFLENFIKKYNIKYDNILAIVDKNVYRHGKKIGNYEIVPPEKINEIKPDVVIFSIKNKAKTIYKSLLENWGDKYSGIELAKCFF